ncbi:MAG: sterol desaturase family protein [Burkholderiales bacterium]|nr:sterol desaturase family protein [Burkholderiales bacterium]
MAIFSLEHSRFAWRVDLSLYGMAIVALMAVMLLYGPRAQWFAMAVCVPLGLGSWTIIEYVLHRFVLHGAQPFQDWHAKHHQQPKALIYTPTFFSATLIFAFVFLPAWVAGGLWIACALTLGILVGYLAYSVTHHNVHHRQIDFYFKHRRYCHALHHHALQPGCYGVTSSFWDRVFGTLSPAAFSKKTLCGMYE